MSLILYGVICVLGLVLGSFATAIAHRELEGRSWYSFKQGDKRSACPHCGHKLSIMDLVPLFSWLSLRGRCRYCQKPISILYPLTEIASALIALFVLSALGMTGQSALIILAIPFFAALCVVDLKAFLLPNRLVVIVALIGCVYALISPAGIIDHAIGGFFYGAFALALMYVGRLMFKKKALGMGDVKFFAAAGLWLGFVYLPFFCMLSGALGLFLALMRHIGGQGDHPYVPLGPALIISLLVLLLFGSSFLTFFGV